jgi:hypothetical protein
MIQAFRTQAKDISIIDVLSSLFGVVTLGIAINRKRQIGEFLVKKRWRQKQPI